MSKKIKITESQLKVLLDNNKKLSEQMSDDGDTSLDNGEESVPSDDNPTPENSNAGDFDTLKNLVASISERLSNAISTQNWDLVKGVLGDLNKPETNDEPSSEIPSGGENTESDKNIDHSSVSFVSESIQKIKADFKRFI